MTGDQLAWPGRDKQRALNCCFHLIRAMQTFAGAARLPNERQRRLISASRMHSRIARGYLGAVGFEHKARL